MAALAEKKRAMYQCYRLFQVEASSPVAGGEAPLHSIDVTPQSFAANSVAIELSCYQETANYTLLVLVCSNGYLVFRLQPFLCQPIVKQLKWFEGRSQHILGVTLDPLGEWLACACLDGCVYLVPVLSLMMPDCFPSHQYGPLHDVAKAEPTQKVSPPTAIVWWESMDGTQICITGSELGEITFFSLHELKQIHTINMKGCIDQLLIAHQSDRVVHLLINLRGGEWWWVLLEERYHEAADTSYTDVQASGFEVVYDDAVLRTILVRPEMSIFEPKRFQKFNELCKLSTQDWNNLEMLGAINLKDPAFELYSYNFDHNPNPVLSFKLCNGTTSVQATERLLFTISHNDDVEEYKFTLSVISRELAQRNSSASAVLQQFELTSDSTVVGFFTTKLESSHLATESRELTMPTNLGGCLVVTSTAVYQCRQICSPESLFLELALSDNSHHFSDEIAITYRLDICGLYKAAAECKLSKGDYHSALRLFQQAKTPASEVIQSFISREHIPELLKYLQEAVYDESSLAPSTCTKPQLLQDILFKCYVHQCLNSDNDVPELLDSLTQFINDKFLYDQNVAMRMLVDCGLIEPLLELAKTHRRVSEALELLLAKGNRQLSASLEGLVANKQFAEHLASVGNGILFHQLSPLNVAKCVIAQPSILEICLSHVVSVLPQLDITVLVRLARVLDPSHSTIQPLLHHAHSSLKRSSSTGSIVSVISAEGTGASSSTAAAPTAVPTLSSYIEAFLNTLIILQYKRERKPLAAIGLMMLSPLHDKLGQTLEELTIRPVTVFADGSKLLRGHVISCGFNHAALVTGGHLYTWGSTRNGKLGHGEIEQLPSAAPLRVETFSMLSVHVVAVSCGTEHTVALCQEGVYSWGSSTHGQLGHGDTLKRPRPVQIASLADIAIVTIVCGQYHCIALDENHSVWVWGWGVHGQLGLGICDDILTPTHAKGMDSLKVSFVAAGFNHSAVISHEGKLYTFGNGMYGQLGHGHQEKQIVPCRVEALADKIVYLVGCGTSHTLAVCTDQSVYHWGKNLHKPQPGNTPQSLRQYTRSRRDGATSPAVANALSPVLIHGLELDGVIVEVGCGNSHCLLLLTSGTVLSWGSNVHGQIGHTHIPELSHPKCISKLDKHHVLAVSCGDEFSIGVDDAGVSWVWGRDDLGQLGMDFSPVKEGKKICIFAPNPNPQIPRVPSIDKPVSPEQSEESLLQIDLGWVLPDFASIDTSSSYGRDTLLVALDSLHGYYRSTHVIHCCKQWEDWKSIATIFTKEKQWQQVLYWSLQYLSVTDKITLTNSLSAVEEYLNHFIADSAHVLYSRNYIITTSNLLQQVLQFWRENDLNMTPLENLFRKFLSSIAYPLSILFRRDTCHDISFKFSMEVTLQVISSLSDGVPPVDEILDTPLSASNSNLSLKPCFESSPEDHRIWTEVLRNIFKDLSKRDNLTLSDLQLSQFDQKLSQTRDAATDKSLVIFSCGHVFAEKQFQQKVLSEFRERLHDLPRPFTYMTSLLLHYYKHSTHFSSACPYCVFQHLRTNQLQYCPGVPIRPWNP